MSKDTTAFQMLKEESLQASFIITKVCFIVENFSFDILQNDRAYSFTSTAKKNKEMFERQK